jgi:hypothetical protein
MTGPVLKHRARRQPARRRRSVRQRGMALMTTVWLSLFMALLAATIATLARTDGASRRNAADLVRARALASSALHLALADLAEPAGSSRFAHDGTPAVIGFKGDTLAIAIEDERGKLDLRMAPRQHVEALFRSLGAGAGQDGFDAVTLAQRIQTRLKIQDPGDSRAVAVQSLGSLASMDGMTPQLFAALVHHATVFGFGAEVNPMTAAPVTLSAIEGIGPAEKRHPVGQAAGNTTACHSTRRPLAHQS